MADDSDFVYLNVGGVKFMTTKTTLVKGAGEASTFFTGLFGGNFTSAKDHKGAYLIDRNPENFRCILEYMRTGHIDLPKGICREQFIADCRYYCLDALIEQLTTDSTEWRLPRTDGFYECIIPVSKGRAAIKLVSHTSPMPKFWEDFIKINFPSWVIDTMAQEGTYKIDNEGHLVIGRRTLGVMSPDGTLSTYFGTLVKEQVRFEPENVYTFRPFKP